MERRPHPEAVSATVPHTELLSGCVRAESCSRVLGFLVGAQRPPPWGLERPSVSQKGLITWQ